MSEGTTQDNEARDIIPEIAREAEEHRRAFIAEIEKQTNRHVLNYFAPATGQPGTIMFLPDIMNLTRVMVKHTGLKGVDLVLNSPGGQPEIAEKIVTMLRHFYDDDLRVIVPEYAKSAATIVCLGADEIVMGYCSELGPIDPQMSYTDAKGIVTFRSAHAVIESVDSYVRAAHDAIAESKPFQAYVRLLDFHPDLTFVEECRLAARLAEELAQRLLKAKMLRDKPHKAEEAAKALSRADRLFSHGRAIDYRFAKDELGLNIRYVPPDDELWRNVWQLHIRSSLAGVVKLIESSERTMAFGM